MSEDDKALVERLQRQMQAKEDGLNVRDRRIEQLTAEVERLRAALQFYADPKHHAYVKAAGCNCIEADGGDTARAALEGKQ